MDKKAIYSLSYGIFMLSTKVGDKANGCIINTCIQVANNPTRVAISVLNTNYTCDLLKESGVFALSVLDEQCTFDSIKHFGFQSGRDVDKFKDLKNYKGVKAAMVRGDSAWVVTRAKLLEEGVDVDSIQLVEVDSQANVAQAVSKG